MATESTNGGDSNETLRKLLVPAAIGVVGSAVGFVLTKRQTVRDALPKVREAIPQLPEGGVGEIAEDLRSRLDSVVGSRESGGGGGGDRSEGTAAASPQIDFSEFEKRRAERRQRRDQRRRRTKT